MKFKIQSFRFWLSLYLLIMFNARAQENLVKNPDFIEGESFPSSWIFESGMPDSFETKWSKNIFEKPAVLEIIFTDRDWSGYFTQWISVKENTNYRLSVSIKQIGGKGLLWITGFDKSKKAIVGYERRKYLPSFHGNGLVPNFVPKKWMKGTDQDTWSEVHLDFSTKTAVSNSNEIAFLRIAMGPYFSVSHFWFAQVRLQQTVDPTGK